jgi:HK97 family phage major capsid protein
MLSFTEAQKALDEKRGEIRAFIDKHKTAEGAWDMSAEDLAEFHKRNDELEQLGKDYDQAGELKRVDDKLKEAEEKRIAERRPIFPAGDTKTMGGERKTFGQRIVEHADYKAGVKAARGTVGPVMEFPDVDLKTLFARTAGWDPEVTRTGQIVYYATEMPSVVDLLPQTETGQQSVAWMEETTYTNAAAEKAEGVAYPEAALALTEQTMPVRKIAVYIPTTDEQLEDEPRVRGYLDNRLTFMLKQRLDSQLVAGTGVAPNLTGVLAASGIQTQAKGTDPSFDAIYKAITKVRVTGQAIANVVLLHPNDWQDIRLTRTQDGLYILGNPADQGPQRLFGLTVAISTNETENTGVVGDFQNYSELAVRRGVDVQIGYQNDDFTKGLKTIRADVRVAAIWYRGTAFCKVTGL